MLEFLVIAVIATLVIVGLIAGNILACIFATITVFAPLLIIGLSANLPALVATSLVIGGLAWIRTIHVLTPRY
jgi:hypothetical protein